MAEYLLLASVIVHAVKLVEICKDSGKAAAPKTGERSASGTKVGRQVFGRFWSSSPSLQLASSLLLASSLPG